MSFKCQSYMPIQKLFLHSYCEAKDGTSELSPLKGFKWEKGQDRGQEAGLSLFIVSSSLAATSVWPVSPPAGSGSLMVSLEELGHKR